jgi:hypothetical protein
MRGYRSGVLGALLAIACIPGLDAIIERIDIILAREGAT